jgi:hypothetical protein
VSGHPLAVRLHSLVLMHKETFTYLPQALMINFLKLNFRRQALGLNYKVTLEESEEEYDLFSCDLSLSSVEKIL